MTGVLAIRDSLAMGCALMTALSNGIAVTAQHIASTSSRGRERGWPFIRYLLGHPLWLLGWLALAGSLGFQSLALHFAPMSVVQPVLILELVLALVLRRVWLRQAVSARAWKSSVITVGALAIFLVAVTYAAPAPGASAHRWTSSSAACVALVGVLVLIARKGPGARRATLYGTATAVLWALEAALIKETTDVITRVGYVATLTHWPVYAVVAFGIAGLACEQAALHVGPLRSSQTAIVIADPVVSVILGWWIFGERLGATWVARFLGVLALLATLMGSARLIRAMPETMEPSSLGPPSIRA